LTDSVISRRVFRKSDLICVKIADLQILLIDNYDSFTYNIADGLRTLGYHDICVVPNKEVEVERASAFDKIILSPGPATPRESGRLMDLIQALAPTHSMLGICLGHQAIAEVFGARLLNMPQPRHGHISRLQIVKPHALFNGIVDERIGLYHSWVVDEEDFPEDLLITAYSNEGHIMALRHKSYALHGVQFHPESYMTPSGLVMLHNFLRLSE